MTSPASRSFSVPGWRLVRSITFAALVSGSVSVTASAEDAPPSGYIQLDETVISGNQELPKVLYIVPWREPTGLPQIDMDPQFTELEVFRRLYPPAYRRELDYHETLTDQSGSDSDG